MNSFVTALKTQEARTANGMKAQEGTGSSLVDLFFFIGNARKIDITPKFIAAYNENPELAARIALWARDARGGAGERESFRKILRYLSDKNPELCNRLLTKTPEVGRWDDVLTVHSDHSYNLIRKAIEEKNGLAAKWMPRKGADAALLRKALGMTPKQYRKTLVNLTNVVETPMCAKDWNSINYSHVPSVASARYQKAFNKNDASRYAEWKKGLETGETKVNSSVLYPYEVIKSIKTGDKKVALAQWNALPDYCDDSSILPVIDVSDSMTWFEVTKGITGLDVAMSLGLYLSERNKGAYKDTFCTFSSVPIITTLRGDFLDKLAQLRTSNVGGSTNLNATFDKILEIAVKNNVPQEDLPGTVLILSDMQFNSCVRYDDSAYQMIVRKYTTAGYKIPKVIFWNLSSAYGNVPVSFDKRDTALVSGFSPAIMKAIISGEDFTPIGIMMTAIMNTRYDF